MTDGEQQQDALIHDGVCPVCGEEFGDGWETFDEGNSIEDVRMCVVEKDDEGEIGESIVHLPEEIDS